MEDLIRAENFEDLRPLAVKQNVYAMCGGPKEKRGARWTGGLKLFSFLNFWLLFVQAKSDKKQQKEGEKEVPFRAFKWIMSFLIADSERSTNEKRRS